MTDVRPGPASSAGPVLAGWAVMDKEPGDLNDYSVRRAGGSYFSVKAYGVIFRRFSPGTPPPRRPEPSQDALPWVTVCYAPLGKSARGGAVAFGVAIRTWTDDVDGAGRRIARTTFLCIPFDAARDRPVSYRQLHDMATSPAVVAQMDGMGRPGIPLDLQPLAPTVLVDPIAAEDRFRLAALAAAAALAGPVAILGAPVVAADRQAEARLKILDAIAALLPYGQRSRLVAGTWADSGTSHRLHVTFTDRPRPGQPAVDWSGQGRPPTLPPAARAYYDLLIRQREHNGFLPVDIAAHLSDPAYTPAHAIDVDHALRALGALGTAPAPARPPAAGHLPAEPEGPPPELPPEPAKPRPAKPEPTTSEPTRTEQATPEPEAAGPVETGADLGSRLLAASAVSLDRAEQAAFAVLDGYRDVYIDHPPPGPHQFAREVVDQLAAGAPEAAAVAALELLRQAVQHDGREVRIGTPLNSATGNTEFWLSLLDQHQSLAEVIRPFQDVLAGTFDKRAFDAVSSRERYLVTVFMLGRHAGQVRLLRPLVLPLLTKRALNSPEREAWARELTACPKTSVEFEAWYDAILLLLGSDSRRPMRERVLVSFNGEYYVPDLLKRFDEIIRLNRVGEATDRVLVSAADSISRHGWPKKLPDGQRMLSLLADLARRALPVPRELRQVVRDYAGSHPSRRTNDHLGWWKDEL